MTMTPPLARQASRGHGPSRELAWLLLRELGEARGRKLALYGASHEPERSLVAAEVALLEAWMVRLALPLMRPSGAAVSRIGEDLA
jgi:hypothetical protein